MSARLPGSAQVDALSRQLAAAQATLAAAGEPQRAAAAAAAAASELIAELESRLGAAQAASAAAASRVSFLEASLAGRNGEVDMLTDTVGELSGAAQEAATARTEAEEGAALARRALEEARESEATAGARGTLGSRAGQLR